MNGERKMTFHIVDDVKAKFKVALAKERITMRHFLESCIIAFISDDKEIRKIIEKAKRE